MIDIMSTDTRYINIANSQIWDGTINNYSGGYKIQVSIMPGQSLYDLDNRLIYLENQIRQIRIDEERLKNEHPAVKSAWEQYRIAVALAKVNG